MYNNIGVIKIHITKPSLILSTGDLMCVLCINILLPSAVRISFLTAGPSPTLLKANTATSYSSNG